MPSTTITRVRCLVSSCFNPQSRAFATLTCFLARSSLGKFATNSAGRTHPLDELCLTGCPRLRKRVPRKSQPGMFRVRLRKTKVLAARSSAKLRTSLATVSLRPLRELMLSTPDILRRQLTDK